MRLFWVSFKHYDQTKNEYKVCWIDKDKKGHCYCLVVKFLFSQYGVYSNIATAALKSYFTVGRLWKWKGSICFKASGTNLARALLFEMPFALRSSRAIALWTTWQNWPWVQHFDLWQQQSCHHPKCVMDRSKKNLVWKIMIDHWLIPWISLEAWSIVFMLTKCISKNQQINP